MKKEMNSKKKGIVKKIILGAVAVLVIVAAIDVIQTKIYSSKIPHRFATAEEGSKLMLANTDYYAKYNQADIDKRLETTGGTLDELLDASEKSVKDFNFFEKFVIDNNLAKMYRKLEKNNYELPAIDEIVFVKANMRLENGANGYTHKSEIYVSDLIGSFPFLDLIPGSDINPEEFLWHEIFHCITRNNPDFRKDAYSLINFTIEDSDFELPPCVKDIALSNPDVDHRNSFATFNIDGQNIDCFICRINTDDIIGLVPTDGSDTYYTRNQASNFDDVFGTNTNYLTDPEECLANNFKYAMTYGIEGKDGNGYPNPEIIQGMIDLMSK